MSEKSPKQESKMLKRLSLNTRLSAARIFEEDSNDSVTSNGVQTTGKMKTVKKGIKSSPYKNDRPDRSRKPKIEFETDKAILERRQKQIDYGRNTVGYDNYIKQIPKHERTNDHPKTPVKHLKYSRRGWDGLIKTWRQKLHEFDPANSNLVDQQDDEETYDDEEVAKCLEDISKYDFEDFI